MKNRIRQLINLDNNVEKESFSSSVGEFSTLSGSNFYASMSRFDILTGSNVNFSNVAFGDGTFENLTGSNLYFSGTEKAIIIQEGELSLSGSSTCWDDILVTSNNIRVNGTAGTDPPVYSKFAFDSTRGTNYSGLFAYSFPYEANSWRDASFTVQFPHSFKQDSIVHPHVHCRLDPADANQVGKNLLLEVEYIWTNVHEATKHNSSTDNTTIITYNYTTTSASIASDNWIIPIPPAGIYKENSGISSILEMRFSRIVKNASWPYPVIDGETGLVNDDFNGTFLLKSFDVHYEIDSFGSKEEYIK